MKGDIYSNSAHRTRGAAPLEGCRPIRSSLAPVARGWWGSASCPPRLPPDHVRGPGKGTVVAPGATAEAAAAGFARARTELSPAPRNPSSLKRTRAALPPFAQSQLQGARGRERRMAGRSGGRASGARRQLGELAGAALPRPSA